jgi:magnesium chelatase family protein
MNAPQVIVEVDLSAGLPGLSIVGLPETAVKESKDRVRAAIINSRFEFPNNRFISALFPKFVWHDNLVFRNLNTGVIYIVC